MNCHDASSNADVVSCGVKVAVIHADGAPVNHIGLSLPTGDNDVS